MYVIVFTTCILCYQQTILDNPSHYHTVHIVFSFYVSNRTEEVRYFYNGTSGRCEEFIGCEGRGNNFETSDRCHYTCEGNCDALVNYQSKINVVKHMLTYS